MGGTETCPEVESTMPDFSTQILEALGRPSYSPIKPKVLAKRLAVPEQDYPAFRSAPRGRHLARQPGRAGRAQPRRPREVRKDPVGKWAS